MWNITPHRRHICIWENIVIVTFGEEVGSAMSSEHSTSLHLHTHTSREFRISRMNSSARNFLWISTFSHSRMDGIEYGKINCYFLYLYKYMVWCCMSCLMQTEYNEWARIHSQSSFRWVERISSLFLDLSLYLPLNGVRISNGNEKMFCVRQRSQQDYVHTINFEAKHRKFVRIFARRKSIWMPWYVSAQ